MKCCDAVGNRVTCCWSVRIAGNCHTITQFVSRIGSDYHSTQRRGLFLVRKNPSRKLLIVLRRAHPEYMIRKKAQAFSVSLERAYARRGLWKNESTCLLESHEEDNILRNQHLVYAIDRRSADHSTLKWISQLQKSCSPRSKRLTSPPYEQWKDTLTVCILVVDNMSIILL